MTFWQFLLADLRAIVTDKAIAITLFGGVLFYSVLYPLPYLNQVPTEQMLVVIDHDGSSLSRRLIRHADASPKITVTGRVSTIETAQSWIESGRANGLLVIPHGFRKDLMLGRGSTLSYGGDANYFLIYSAVVEGLVSVGLDAGKYVQLVGLLAHGENAKAAERSLNAVKLNSVPAFNPSLGYTPYVVPGVLLLVLHQTLLIGTGILGAGQWQNQGYWRRVSPLMLISGRICVFFLIYTLFTSLYVGHCYYWYGVSVQATLWQVALFLLPFLLSTAVTGIAFSCLFTRRDLPTQVLLLISMPILFVSGFVWPLELIPDPLIWISTIIPAVPAIIGMLQLNQMGASWASIMPLWLHLWGLFALFFMLALYGVNKRLKREPNSEL
ncbi:ABC transporter permease [Shewanella canadensis]|uniref:ABC transporter permease n=1 Tax=Shewanella canadensis TaxID=271096 RepID=A0A3S0KYQ1_9GAMM|nr:ABC transporter permease [Shewanella canadensis]RTR40487.1 ABC transporter permease [Shewanella canadensis]